MLLSNWALGGMFTGSVNLLSNLLHKLSPWSIVLLRSC